MDTDVRAAVLAEEQHAVDHAYDCVDLDTQKIATMRGTVRTDCPDADLSPHTDLPPEYGTRDDLGELALVTMRVDLTEDPDKLTWYVGRRTVRNSVGEIVVLKWTNDEPTRWRLATPQKPGPVKLRRTLRCAERKVQDFSDEEINGSRPSTSPLNRTIPPWPIPLMPPELDAAQASDAPFLLADLDLARDGLMRDIVETIQRDQLRLVSDDRRGLLVVQGGPGTGKTAVGLHRVTWLLDNKRFTAGEVLVLGPHREFLRYVSQVLPRLDSHGVTTIDMARLWEGDVRGTDSFQARLVKSDERMAEVLHRSLESQIRPDLLDESPDAELRFTFKAATLGVPLADVRTFAEEARDASGPYLVRRRFIDKLLDHLLAAYAGITRRQSVEDNLRSELEKNTHVRALLTQVWPAISPEQALRHLLSDRDTLRAVASGLLTLDEQDTIVRPQAGRVSDEPWTPEDLVCLEELRHLLKGEQPQRYRHLIVDEAQDLTPMQARSLARRCPTGSMTVLGDLAQATGPRHYDVWGRLAAILTGEHGWYMAELTTGYRVPAEVMDFAAPLAATVSPSTAFPVSVRPAAEGTLNVVPVTSDDLVYETVTRALMLAVPDGDQHRSVAIIVPDEKSLFNEVRQELKDSQPPVGDTDELPVTVLPASMAKGMEFDHVLVVEPARVAGHGPAGLRQLYVAITRCTQTLTVLHTTPLPAELDPNADEEPPALATTAPDAAPQATPTPPAPQRQYTTYDDFRSHLEENVRTDRECHVHEEVRYALISELFRARLHPSSVSPFADIICDTPGGRTVYEVLGEHGNTFQRLREGAQRILDVEQALGERRDYLFLVLPEPPEHLWAAEIVEKTYSVSVIWKTESGWDGTDIGTALGRGSS